MDPEEKVPLAPKQKMNSLLILLSAPSGGGKTTVCQQMLAVRSSLVRAVTCTTRLPRTGEQHGIDYYFLDAAMFGKRVEAGEFLEHATVFGNNYGTLKSEVLEKLGQGKDVLLAIDVQGAAAVRAAAAQDRELRRALVTVFLTPPSVAILEERLRKRGSEAPALMEKRLSMARQEIAQWSSYDYLVISSSIEEDLRRMLVILDAEKLRTTRLELPELQGPET